MDIDFAELASLVTLLKEADFTEFRYEKGEVRIVVRRGDEPANATGTTAPPTAVPAAAPARASRTAPAAPAAAAAAPLPPGAQRVTAPLLGTFYAAPKPGEAPFVKVGDRVEPDTVLCIVEVMKLMNSVHAGCSGVVLAVHASNGDLVEFGQPLFSIQAGNA
ncbi:acetyl-CoA carboxylase biotin carboxyl carrier protein [Hydrogenophaga sp.]|uniref:acetyl-CoA carboxylase biotin carboxyl carrier protein n=1 Tax=Hydrogenophaga sp. TaxID=1904254 RepID=UPI002627BFE6|nr:acetyl-CoA carboxylase biotin carboxyl carrier protein [Hydrogenophaga sp.]MCW5653681.1 acetyl-CoA carboxylase biotin carboxyl carrier protein [Hydrogenophaga sp.]